MVPVRIAVIGVGAFGRNHVRVYRELESAHPGLVRLVAFVEPNAAVRSAAAESLKIPGFPSVEALLASPYAPDAASVCVPTIHHAAVAEQLLAAGIDVLIEKPFAASLAEADSVLALAHQHHRILQIGHLERFNPAVTATIPLLNRPMFFEAHRLSIFTPRSLDVDVVLDLMIHDLDVVLAMTHSPVREVRAVGLPILSRKVDIANVRIEFESGCIANFTASRVSTEQVRKLRLFQPHQYISLDFARQEVINISVDPAILSSLDRVPQVPGPHPSRVPQVPLLGPGFQPPPDSPSPEASPQPGAPGPASGTWVPTPATTLSSRPEAALLAAGAERPAAPPAQPPQPGTPNHHTSSPHPSAGLTIEKLPIAKAEPLRLELEDFLHACHDRTTPRVPGEAGAAALALALEINSQIAAHAKRTGLR